MAEYRLYYAGLNAADGVEQIGLAVSADLKTWTRPFTKPIIPVGFTGDADRAQTSNPFVMHEKGIYRMWYQGKSLEGRVSICYAESRDGLTWQPLPSTVFAPSGEPTGEYREGYQHPHVLFDVELGLYRMWLSVQSGGTARIGYAESPDGYAWKMMNDSILFPNGEWEGSFLYYPFVRTLDDGSYELWYTGRPKGRLWMLGRATSTDGVLFAKDEANPLLPRLVPPRFVRTLIDKAAPFLGHTFNAAFGTGSPCIVGGTMLAHDVGAKGRLSIGIYKSTDGQWVRNSTDILAEGSSPWDAYFQADPFLLAQ